MTEPNRAMRRVATLTVNPAIDKSTSVDQVVPDRKLRCEPPRREPGGGGVNVSRAIHRLGGTSTLLYMAGGLTGDILRRLLDDEGLDHRMIATDGWTRENLMVLEERSGQQFRFGMPGPEIREEEWMRCLDELSSLDPPPEYLVASGSLAPGIPDDFYRRVAGVARDIGARLVVDTSGEALHQIAHGGAYLLKPNVGELRALVGEEVEGEEAQERAARKLISEGCCTVIVLSLGSGGARVITADTAAHVRTPTVPIRSRVGAGDSTVAGIVLGLARGMELLDAVRLGVAAGAAAVMTAGSELCRREDVERLYARMASA